VRWDIQRLKFFFIFFKFVLDAFRGGFVSVDVCLGLLESGAEITEFVPSVAVCRGFVVEFVPLFLKVFELGFELCDLLLKARESISGVLGAIKFSLDLLLFGLEVGNLLIDVLEIEWTNKDIFEIFAHTDGLPDFIGFVKEREEVSTNAIDIVGEVWIAGSCDGAVGTVEVDSIGGAVNLKFDVAVILALGEVRFSPEGGLNRGEEARFPLPVARSDGVHAGFDRSLASMDACDVFDFQIPSHGYAVLSILSIRIGDR
jgi:hypothetical protein